ncbi:hypothetical protein KAJ83_13565 [Marivibrio halodurans]|uniref:Uncharacterized protein n=1 Tax=Marivibrio halodurans TaxID=2039722 RepID=A0A8J7V3A9_9PROT|nr:hypothetical protein [Marivibrio halodurans]MBP5858041.1 hypothetical protein [Marivibrio halodurans]
MSFDEYKAEISLLMNEMEGEQGDLHEVMMRLKTILDTMRAEGLPIPDDLKRFEQDLDARFSVPGGSGD